MTTMAVLLALGVASGLSAPAVVVIGTTVIQPWTVIALAIVHGVVSRTTHAGRRDETAILAAIAAELRAGRSLRQALAGPGATSADHPMRPVARLAAHGVSFSELTPLIREALPASSPLVVPAIGMLEVSGANAASVFELLAESHAMQKTIEDEHRAALAPAGYSASILMALAAGGLIWLVSSGRMSSLLSDTTGQVLAAVGAGFIAAGAVVFMAMLRRGSGW